MVDYDNIPDELRKLKQWVCVSEDSKVPMKSWERDAASSSNPNTWSDFGTALESVHNLYYDYCGFVFAGNGYVGIDIDCGYDDDGFISTIGVDIINKCQSYTEKSRSGRGFHIILRGTLPFKGKNNLAGVEIYQTGRYFIMTGDIFLSYRKIVENQKAIDYVIEKYFQDTRTNKKSVLGNRIYSPIWDNPVIEGRVKLRPTYPIIPNGCRNISLTSLAGMWWNTGYTKKQIYNELQYVNSIACNPHLGESELQAICNSITRYSRK